MRTRELFRVVSFKAELPFDNDYVTALRRAWRRKKSTKPHYGSTRGDYHEPQVVEVNLIRGTRSDITKLYETSVKCVSRHLRGRAGGRGGILASLRLRGSRSLFAGNVSFRCHGISARGHRLSMTEGGGRAKGEKESRTMASRVPFSCRSLDAVITSATNGSTCAVKGH